MAVNVVSVLSLACWLVFGSVSSHCYGVWLPCCLLLGGECTRTCFQNRKVWISIDFGISVELDESGVDVFVC